MVLRRDVIHIHDKIVPLDMGGGLIQWSRDVNTTYHEQDYFYLRDRRNCGSKILLTKYMVFIGCAEHSIIEIYAREEMYLFRTIEKFENLTIGADWTVLEPEKGRQIFLFVPVTDHAGFHSLVYYEVLLNPENPPN